MHESTARRALSAALRVDWARVSVATGLRCGSVVASALVCGIATDHVEAGVAVAGGALLAAFTDPGGAAWTRAATMLAGSAVAAASSWAAMTLGAHDVLVVCLAAALSFGAAMLLALGPVAAVGLVATLSMVIGSTYPTTAGAALRHSLYALAGGGLQAAVALLLTPGSGRAPRNAVAAATRSLAKGATGPRLSGYPAAMTAADELATHLSGEAKPPMLLQLVRGTLDELERVANELSSIAVLRSHIGDVTLADGITAPVAQVLLEYAEAVQTGRRPRPDAEIVDELRAASERVALEAQHAPGSALATLAARSDAVRGQLRAMEDMIGLMARERGGLAGAASAPLVPWPADALEVLRANMTLQSPVMRHAIRLAFVLPVAMVIARRAPGGHGYWVPLSVVLVLRPDFGQTLTRGLQRFAGTAIGVLAATLLADALEPGPYGLAALVLVTCAVAFTVVGANYAAFSAAFSATIVLLVSFGGIAAASTARDRFRDIVIGSTLALLAYLVWPTWEGGRTRSALADLIESDRKYVARVVMVAGAGAPADGDELTRLRIAGRRHRTAAQASLERSQAEPARAQADARRAAGVLAATWRLAAAALALEAHVRSAPSTTVMARTGPDQFIASLGTAADTALAQIARSVRDGSPLGPLPPLRRLHDGVVREHGADMFVVTLLDRIVDAIDTLGFLAAD
jgi:uncharacterized membrane protein YccC